MSTDYTAAQIQTLTGLGHVRLRPEMYLGATDIAALHHLIWELVDNAVDEVMAGHGDRVIVTLNDDGSVAVQDFGRGIPVDAMKDGPHKGRSALDVVLTETNAGGKFGDGGYKVSGGLHGVGASVVTAMSARVDAEVWRDGSRYTQTYRAVTNAKGAGSKGPALGVPDGPVQISGRVPKGPGGKPQTGTIITFWPDITLFHDEHGAALDAQRWSTRIVADRFRHKSFIHPGVSFIMRDRRRGREAEQTWFSSGGVADLVAELVTDRALISPVLSFHGEVRGTTVAMSIVWADSDRDTCFGYANGVANPDGGTHLDGTRRAVTEAVQKYIADRGLLKEKESAPTTRDIFEGAVAVVSVMTPSPQFAGNAKSKLMTTEVAAHVRSVILPQLTAWLEENPVDAKRVADSAVATMRIRTKSTADKDAAKALLARASSARPNGLPAKLRDCTRKNLLGRPTELLIVEGDSAGGTTLDARDPSIQAVLPIKGKPANSIRTTLDKLVKDGSIADLVLSLGAGIGNDFDIDKMRYDRILAVADADVDGQHIRGLLTIFFHRWMPGVLEAGRFFVAQPPLYSTVVRGERIYIADDRAKTAFLEQHPTHKAPFGRLKGLGEMDAHELKTAIDPRVRRVTQIVVNEPARLDSMTRLLFGPKVEPRLDWFLARSGQTLEIGDESAPTARPGDAA